MESWRDELYHYGIKGMKWKKRKKGMSDLERAGRNYETNFRRKWDAFDQDPNRYINDFEDMYKKFSRPVNRSKEKVAKYHERVKRKAEKNGGLERVYSGGNSNILSEIASTENKKGYHNQSWTTTGKAREKAEKKTHRKVKAYDRKWKAKNAIKSFFKKKG